MTTHHDRSTTAFPRAIEMVPSPVPDSPVTGIMLPGGRVIPVAHHTAASPTTATIYRGAGTYTKTGTMTCDTCNVTQPETKFPTRPVNAAGIIVRKSTCRACERIRRTIARTVTVGDMHPVDVEHHIDAMTAETAMDDRMAARWANNPAGRIPPHAVASAVATVDMMVSNGA